mmetsp:Transcript_24920/g.64925  ORF Transcript_24920/g.64925 Transcript_24920/m.64925 type:complete len:262 (-) Transcript_24920:1252-2037(-)
MSAAFSAAAACTAGRAAVTGLGSAAALGLSGLSAAASADDFLSPLPSGTGAGAAPPSAGLGARARLGRADRWPRGEPVFPLASFGTAVLPSSAAAAASSAPPPLPPLLPPLLPGTRRRGFFLAGPLDLGFALGAAPLAASPPSGSAGTPAAAAVAAVSGFVSLGSRPSRPSRAPPLALTRWLRGPPLPLPRPADAASPTSGKSLTSSIATGFCALPVWRPRRFWFLSFAGGPADACAAPAAASVASPCRAPPYLRDASVGI